jgi:hypothetical protein
MRDDIHKKVPRPREVQSWVKSATRAADRETGKTMEKLETSVRYAARELGARFVEGLKGRLADGGGDLFGLSGVQSPRELGGSGSTLERQVLSDCQRRIASGDAAADAIHGAIEDALRDRSCADIRAAEPVLLPEGGRKAIDQMKKDVAGLNYGKLATDVIGGERRVTVGRVPLSADEDLLAPAARSD